MRNKSILVFCNLMFTLLAIALFTNDINAQEQNIYELTNIKTYKVSAKKVKESNDRSDFYKLSQRLKSTLYYKNNRLNKKHGVGNPIKVVLEDANSLGLLKQKNEEYHRIEIITLIIENESDLNKTLDLSKNRSFHKLKYIYIKCLFDCSKTQIEKFIKKPNNKVRVFYTISKAS